MAVLTEPKATGGFGPRIKEMAPKGTHLATLVDVQDYFNVVRPTFENPSINETVDLTVAIFGFMSKEGSPYLVKSPDMRISGNPKSKLYGFIQQMTGEPPAYGKDTKDLIGLGVQLTVAHRESKRNPGKMYAYISAVSPLMDDLKPKVLPPSTFESLLKESLSQETTLGTSSGEQPSSGKEDEGLRF
jgi:hypothetical protein